MGHCLHGLLSNVTYYALSGTNVARDFVELPSQIMENWAAEPEVLKMYAKHYQTGEVIPQTLVDKMEKAGKFNNGFASTEYLAASFLDIAWHVQTDSAKFDVNAFERKAMTDKKLIAEIIPRYRSTYFGHVFKGEYAVGYYSYIWAEVLDADAFALFKQKGIFDPATAKSFRQNILEKGGTIDQMQLYKQFRGAEPNTDALLVRKGF